MLSNVSKFSLLLFAFVAFTAQKCKKVDPNNYQYNAGTIVSMRTTACFGECPVYTVTLMGTGEATFEGKQFSKKQGMHKKKFEPIKINALIAAFIDADYWSFEDEYKQPITDLPSTYLTFKHLRESIAVVPVNDRCATNR